MRLNAWLRAACAATLATSLAVFAAVHSHAQAQAPTDPDWRELDAPPAPALVLDKLVPLSLERTQLRWGVMPSSIAIGADGIVRYVVVARSEGGAVNAMYEGIRCSSGESKTYARSSGAGWSPVKDSLWEPMNQARQPRYALEIARTGACMGHGTVASATEIVRNLTAPANRRFNEPQ